MSTADLLRKLRDHGLAVFTNPDDEISILPFEEDGISFNLTLMVDGCQVGIGSPAIAHIAPDDPRTPEVMANLLELNSELSWIRLHRDSKTGSFSGLYLMPVPAEDACMVDITEIIFGVANDVRAVLACIQATLDNGKSTHECEEDEVNVAIERLFDECCDEHQTEHPTDDSDAA
jgi:hypothetical protein